MTRTQRVLANIVYYILWLGVVEAAIVDMESRSRPVRVAAWFFFIYGAYRIIFSTPNLGEEKTAK